ncbi:uncharacterized protein LOC128547522 [Mercenaria mercenaria]|uniref:uncharacterized protein LOC128547522 n=1 Tax=Mercenaria mercenaria TaxID=6596 RepID=UPI00234E5B4E|nr:uncharacterized protein LOC128547522 [Mercenaria mercenaria]
MLIIKAEFLVLLIYLHVRLSTCDVHIFVSPHGSDQNDGHSDKVPVNSVQQALSLAGQTKYENATVYLELMPGYHDQDRTLVITRNNTVIRSYRRQQVHLTGGLRIPSSNIKPVTDHAILSRLPVNARSHVQVVNLHDLNITNFGIMDEYGSYRHRNSPLEVFYNGQPLQLARWPDDGYLDIVAVPDGKEGLRFRYNSTVPQSWHNENDPWAYGYWYYAWDDHALKLKSIDPATKTVTLVKKSPHGLRTGHLQEYLNGVSNIEGGYFRFINILSALDKPGEYYVDRDSGKLYMWVPNHDGSVKSSDKIYISMINDCIMIRSKTENVRLEDFTLEYCRRSGLYAPSVRKVKLTQLEIRNTGGSAANFAGDSRECEVSRCYIHDTCGGVWMYGGDRKTLQSSGNVIANNEITRYARVGAVGNEAITLIGVGVTVLFFAFILILFQEVSVYNLLHFDASLLGFVRLEARSWALTSSNDEHCV